MNIPPFPSDEQLSQALTPPTIKLSKRNFKMAIRLLQGEVTREVAATYGLSAERTATASVELFGVLKQRLLTEEQRQQEFALLPAAKLTDYRHPERVGWWLQVLQALVDQAPAHSSFMLDKRISGINIFTRCA